MAEQETFNLKVQGSSPWGRTKIQGQTKGLPLKSKKRKKGHEMESVVLLVEDDQSKIYEILITEGGNFVAILDPRNPDIEVMFVEAVEVEGHTTPEGQDVVETIRFRTGDFLTRSGRVLQALQHTNGPKE